MSDRRADLVRALNLIPYFRAHPDHTLFEAARDLGLDYRQMVADLQRLHTSGVGTHTEELIDLTFNPSRTAVTITQDQGMTTPLRLTPAEAGTLLLVLESLESQLIDSDAVTGAAAKIRGIMAERTAGIVDSAPDDPDPDLVEVNRSLAEGKRLRFRYWSATNDEVTERVVDPARLVLHGGVNYLSAWDRDKGEHRNFHVDRIRSAQVVDEPAEPHLDELPAEPFSFDRRAEIALRDDATWLADYHPITLGDDLGDGTVSAELSYGSDEWLVRFCVLHADRMTLVRPESLARAVSLRAAAGLSGYHEPTS